MPDSTSVLIIDDEREIVRGLSVRLKAAGYDVHTANDGPAGLDATNAVRPDVVVLDLQMPKMDGLQVLERIRNSAETRALPVIILSAEAVDVARSRAVRAGANCLMSKPFQADRLLAAIADVTGRRPGPHH